MTEVKPKRKKIVKVFRGWHHPNVPVAMWAGYGEDDGLFCGIYKTCGSDELIEAIKAASEDKK